MLTQSKIKELFDYKDGKLYWKSSKSKKIKFGDLAGYISQGYERIKINSIKYLSHRLIFLWNKGYLPDYIDHIDGNPLNNNIENLRECTISQNNRNKKISSKSTTGIKNVHFDKFTNKYVVRLFVNGINKNFGRFDDIELAELVAEEVRNKFYGEFSRSK